MFAFICALYFASYCTTCSIFRFGGVLRKLFIRRQNFANKISTSVRDMYITRLYVRMYITLSVLLVIVEIQDDELIQSGVDDVLFSLVPFLSDLKQIAWENFTIYIIIIIIKMFIVLIIILQLHTCICVYLIILVISGISECSWRCFSATMM